jgi:hypothetical protein
MASDFREIFLVTRLGEFDATKTVYIPLKMLFLVAEIYLFRHIMLNEYSDYPTTDPESKNLLMVEYLTWRGARDVYYRNGTTDFEIFYGNTGILPNGETITLKDYTDFSLSKDFKMFKSQNASDIFDENFLQHFQKYKHDTVFKMALGFDVGNIKPSDADK